MEIICVHTIDYRFRAWARISKYKARPKRDISISGTDRPSSKQYQTWTDRCPVHRPWAVSGGPKIGRFKPGGPKFARTGTSLMNIHFLCPDHKVVFGHFPSVLTTCDPY